MLGRWDSIRCGSMMTKKEIWQTEKVNWQPLRNFQDNEFVLFNPCIKQAEHSLVAQTHDSWWCHCTCIAAKLAVLSDRTTWSPDPLKDQNLGLAQFILIYFDNFSCISASFVCSWFIVFDCNEDKDAAPEPVPMTATWVPPASAATRDRLRSRDSRWESSASF